MKKTSFLTGLVAVASALAAVPARAQIITSFTPGDFVVNRVGDGSAALTSAGTAVFLDEYTPGGTFVGSYALPTAAAGATLPVVQSGTASSEGEITVSADGRSILVPGYNAAAGTAAITTTATTAVPREVAVVGLAGGLTQFTTTSFSANNIRGAASVNGSTVYASGANTGIISLDLTTTGTAGTLITSSSTNNRSVAIYNGQLFLSSGSGAFRLATVGTGLPTTTGQTATEVTGISNTGTPAVGGVYGFVAASLAGNGTTDTIYVADNGNGVIDKFSGSLTGGFTLTGTATLAGVTGLSGITVGNTEQLVATTGTNVYILSDTSGVGGTFNGTPTSVAAALTNEAFRGVAFIPVPEPSTCALVALGVGGLFLWARRARRSFQPVP